MKKLSKGARIVICAVTGTIVILAIAAGVLYVVRHPGHEKFIFPETEKDYSGYVGKHHLSNPNADVKTQRIYDYLCDSYGNVMLAGQQESTWMDSPDYEMNYIYNTTGKLPAIRGLDFMNNDFDGVVRRAVEWDAKGGLVTICWHTGVEISGYEESKHEWPVFDRLFTEGTEEHETLMKSWDAAAKALQKLQNAGVTVIWRPFHEFDGRWFWWGKAGAKNFVELWKRMYYTFTYEYGLNNLIWVLGYSDRAKTSWHPGDDFCDIVGSDIYNNGTNARNMNKLRKITGKPLAFHECGKVPSVDKFVEDDALWTWFMVWHTNYITDNNPDTLRAVYADDRVITLDELPVF